MALCAREQRNTKINIANADCCYLSRKLRGRLYLRRFRWIFFNIQLLRWDSPNQESFFQELHNTGTALRRNANFPTAKQLLFLSKGMFTNIQKHHTLNDRKLELT